MTHAFYLDKALDYVDNEVSKSSIIHTLGNLKFAMYRNESDKDKAFGPLSRCRNIF